MPPSRRRRATPTICESCWRRSRACLATASFPPLTDPTPGDATDLRSHVKALGLDEPGYQALIVDAYQELLFISQNGMVQRTSVSGISQMGRSTQGVKVMNIKDDDRVSAVALVVESDSESAPDEEVPVDELPVAAEADGDGG